MENTKFDKQEIDSGKGLAAVSYLGALALIPYFTEKKNKFVRFHAVQGINLLLIGVALAILQWIITAIITASTVSSAIYGYGYGYASSVVAGAGALGVVSIIFMIVWILFGILEIIGIINAASGKANVVPILGKIRIIKK